MPTTRENLVLFFRSEIAKMNEQNVPALMREGNIPKLEAVLKTVDYSFFEDEPTPLFSMEEMHLQDEDDTLSAILYIWKNPYIEKGDMSFVDSITKFSTWVEDICGKYGKKLMYILVAYGYYLTEHKDGESYHGLTLEELLNPEEVEKEAE